MGNVKDFIKDTPCTGFYRPPVNVIATNRSDRGYGCGQGEGRGNRTETGCGSGSLPDLFIQPSISSYVPFGSLFDKQKPTVGFGGGCASSIGRLYGPKQGTGYGSGFRSSYGADIDLIELTLSFRRDSMLDLIPKNSKVFIDVDGVIRNLEQAMRKGCNVNMTVDEYDSPEFKKVWDTIISNKEMAKKVYLRAPAYPMALEAVKRISDKVGKDNVFYLTAAKYEEYPWVSLYTRKWLRRNNFMVYAEAVKFVYEPEDKIPTLESLRGDCPVVMIDDRLKTLQGMPDDVIKIWLYGDLIKDKEGFVNPGDINVYRNFKEALHEEGKTEN